MASKTAGGPGGAPPLPGSSSPLSGGPVGGGVEIGASSKSLASCNGVARSGFEDQSRVRVAEVQHRSKAFWAAKTAVTRNRERGIPLSYCSQMHNADIIDIPSEVWNDVSAKFKNALVGFVFGSKPFLGRVRGFARSKWGDESVVRVSGLSDGIFLLKFASEEKMLEVLSGGPWTFDSKPFIVKPWSEDGDYRCGSIDALPLWVRLPHIKAHLTDPRILSLLCSRLGKPICTDGVTADGSSYNYARVCVEVYSDMELVDSIMFRDPYGNIHTQAVLYEWKPPRCTNCCNFGHLKDKCPEPCLELMIEDLKKAENREALVKDSSDPFEMLSSGNKIGIEAEELVEECPNAVLNASGPVQVLPGTVSGSVPVELCSVAGLDAVDCPSAVPAPAGIGYSAGLASVGNVSVPVSSSAGPVPVKTASPAPVMVPARSEILLKPADTNVVSELVEVRELPQSIPKSVHAVRDPVPGDAADQNSEKHDGGEFKQVLSRSASKRAKLKEKRQAQSKQSSESLDHSETLTMIRKKYLADAPKGKEVQQMKKNKGGKKGGVKSDFVFNG